MKFLRLFALLLIVFSVACVPEDFVQIGYKNEKTTYNNRLIELHILYPTNDISQPDKLMEDPLFKTIYVMKDASVKCKKHPLVILSHGLAGSSNNLLWLVPSLIKEGAVVIITDHPDSLVYGGDAGVSLFWERSQDIEAIINYASNSYWKQHLNTNKIAIAGHSLGGYTALKSLGADFRLSLLSDYCSAKGNEKKRLCAIAYNQYFANISEKEIKNLEANYRNNKIKAAVLFDPGLIGAFTKKSLKRIRVPVNILSAGLDDPTLPHKDEAGYVIQYLPNYENHFIQDSNHLSFAQECEDGAYDILKDNPDAFLASFCAPEARPRGVLHEEMAAETIKFLKKNKIL